MPTNVYFSTGTTSEQRLYEDLIIEQLKIYGQDVYYLPRKIANKDTIFGEDPASSFDDSYSFRAVPSLESKDLIFSEYSITFFNNVTPYNSLNFSEFFGRFNLLITAS